MSEFTDDTLSRYLSQQPGAAEMLINDPAQRAQTEAMRHMLAAAERAMTDEGIPDGVRQRVINRIVWGEPEGFVDVHAKLREQILAAYDLPAELVESWEAIAAAAAGPVRPDEEPTT